MIFKPYFIQICLKCYIFIISPRLNYVFGQDEFSPGSFKNKILPPYDAATTSDQKIRLRGVDRTFGSGRLEIYYRDRWNLVCDKYFTEKEGHVACKALGFLRGLSQLKTQSAFGNGKLTDFIPYLFSCNGSEISLFDCPKQLQSIHCNPITDTVGLECRLNYESLCDKNGILYGKSCYYPIQNSPGDAVNFKGASASCELMGGSLAYIRNQDEMDFISEMLFAVEEDDKKAWYIGGQKSGDSWYWKIKCSLKPSDFTKWKPDYAESNDKNQCIQLARDESRLLARDYYFWSAESCSSLSTNFICQKPAMAIDCMDNERRYDGTVNTTSNGLPCLRWNGPQLLRSRLLFAQQIRWSHNYCRNPDKDFMPWCFVDLKNVGYCRVPECRDYNECDKGEWKCGDSNYCVPEEFVCDFEQDCPNSSDEKNCEDCGRQPVESKIRRIRSTDQDTVEDIASLKPARIVGGYEASPGFYPWTASLRLKDPSRHHCGASILSKFFLITAAHCFEKEKNASKYFVTVGNWDNSVEEPTEKSFQIDKIIIYPDFKNLQKDDLALLKIDSKEGIQSTDYIQPICLPSAYTPLNSTSKCVITGWGSNGETPAKRMQAAELPLIPRARCSSPNVYGSTLSEKSFCAGYLDGGVDACVGDSGGPYACEYKGRYTLTGVVSWGEGCAERNKPGVYTMVKAYTGWIKQEMLKNSDN